MDSYSGIVIEEACKSEHFTDFTDIPCRGHNILCKAMRYGRWWMLKGLKADYRQDANYRNLLHKEFDILISLQHPGIVQASSLEDVPGLGTCIVMEWVDGQTLASGWPSIIRRRMKRVQSTAWRKDNMQRLPWILSCNCSMPYSMYTPSRLCTATSSPPTSC